MEVRLSPELETRLRESAVRQGRETDEVLNEAVTRYFAEESRFVEAVERGERELRRGEYFTHEQVGQRLKRFLRP
jgi:predicted transcriptional regulator